jgi:hypothetical protein
LAAFAVSRRRAFLPPYPYVTTLNNDAKELELMMRALYTHRESRWIDRGC